jgi:endonuclease/exonuclease/phosphatase family metal-dependent hydrolase
VVRNSPRGEVVVVTINAHQFDEDVGRLRTLAAALRHRPRAGGNEILVPDVVLVQEIERDGVTLLAAMLRSRFPGSRYRPVGPRDRRIKSKLIVDLSNNRVLAQRTWRDACDGRNAYLALRLRERPSGEAYAAAGVHLPWDATMPCRVRNATRIKDVLSSWTGAAVVGGDFNQRPVEEKRECDEAEASPALPWWEVMVEDDPRAPGFVDSVRAVARREGNDLGAQWTYEGIAPTRLCDGTRGIRRNRIDYVFVREGAHTAVIAAGADDPGWAGARPGTYRCRGRRSCPYSDHRFTWARVRI